MQFCMRNCRPRLPTDDLHEERTSLYGIKSRVRGEFSKTSAAGGAASRGLASPTPLSKCACVFGFGGPGGGPGSGEGAGVTSQQ